MNFEAELKKAEELFSSLPEEIQEYFLDSFDEAVADGFDWEHMNTYIQETVYETPSYIAEVIRWLPEFSLRTAVKAVKLFCQERNEMWYSKMAVQNRKYILGEHVAMLLAFLVAAVEQRFGEGAEVLELEVPVVRL